MRFLLFGSDSPLSELGVRLAVAMRTGPQAFLRERAQLLVSSTLRRALDTARYACGDLIASGKMRAVALDDARVFINPIRADRSCAVSTHRMGGRFSGWDFGMLPEEDETFDNGRFDEPLPLSRIVEATDFSWEDYGDEPVKAGGSPSKQGPIGARYSMTSGLSRG